MRRFWFHKEDEVRPDALAKVIGSEPEDKTLERNKRAAKPPRPFIGKAGLPKGVAWGIAALAVFFVAGFAVSAFFAARQTARDAASKDAGTLQEGINDLRNLDPAAAAKEFSSIGGASPEGLGSFMEIFGFAFGNAKNMVGDVSGLAGNLTAFSGELQDAASSSFGFFMTGNGGPFIGDLIKLRGTIGAIQSSSDELAAEAGSVGAGAGAAAGAASGTSLFASGNASYLAANTELQSAEAFLDDFIPWISSAAPHHLLIMFQNPSEMRPAGGFLGSYADLVISSGSVMSANVNDIADVDASFSKNIVPPAPLMLNVPKWRPADANWFFDFPTSASQTIAFFDESGLYAGSSTASSTVFDGAIAVSPKVVSDLLSVTGPIAVRAPGVPTTTFNSDNFITETQKIVEQGQAASATYPKAILKSLAGAIFEDLASSTDSQKQELFAMALDWAAKKDVMVYFKDPAMENFAEQYGVGGDVYKLPQRFNGDYLAVVDANIGGGKSDLYVSSTVNYVAQIGADGTLTDQVSVARTDEARASDSFWYRIPNRDYLQIFVPPGSTLSDVSGGMSQRIVPPLNYARAGYSTDPLLASIESSEQSLFAYPNVSWHEESGKQVFSTWLRVAPGASAKFSIGYTRNLFIPPASGVGYQFVFEKQAGSERSYSYEVDAPLGYVFEENGLASWTYASDDPPGRLVVNLTLKRL